MRDQARCSPLNSSIARYLVRLYSTLICSWCLGTMPFPISLCQRHPRYVLFLAGLLAVTFFLLSSSHSEHQLRSPHALGLPPDPSLPARVTQAEEIYKGVLEQRESLIKKFGPSPAQVVMYVSEFHFTFHDLIFRFRFPPDQEPWPAYTVCEYHRLFS